MCDASSFGLADESAVSRFEAIDAAMCSGPSVALSSSDSSISRPNIPLSPGEGGPHPGGSSWKRKQAIGNHGVLN